MLERALLSCLLTFGIVTGYNSIAELIEERVEATSCAIRSYTGCVAPAAVPGAPTTTTHRFFSVEAD